MTPYVVETKAGPLTEDDVYGIDNVEIGSSAKRYDAEFNAEVTSMIEELKQHQTVLRTTAGDQDG